MRERAKGRKAEVKGREEGRKEEGDRPTKTRERRGKQPAPWGLELRFELIAHVCGCVRRSQREHEGRLRLMKLGKLQPKKNDHSATFDSVYKLVYQKAARFHSGTPTASSSHPPPPQSDDDSGTE